MSNNNNNNNNNPDEVNKALRKRILAVYADSSLSAQEKARRVHVCFFLSFLSFSLE
jgi:hypothetical protein